MNKLLQRLAALLMLALPLQASAEVDSIVLGMGCFWGAEKRMAAIPGVLDVESGYAGGDARKVSYYDLISLDRSIRWGLTGQRNHAEVVKVRFDPERVSPKRLLIGFWESHDPTQGDRQGNDVGSRYRSAIYTNGPEQKRIAQATRSAYQHALTAAGYGRITTEIAPLRNYNRAEEYHQDYLRKNPSGYCGLGGTGVAYPGQPGKAQPTALSTKGLSKGRQLIVFESEDCPYCERFQADILDDWTGDTPVVSTMATRPPQGWRLDKPLFATPTIVLFENGKEVSRYTGYRGEEQRFRKWLKSATRKRSKGIFGWLGS